MSNNTAFSSKQTSSSILNNDTSSANTLPDSTTNFETDGLAVENRPSGNPLDTSISLASTDGVHQGITDFMKKPYILTSGQITTSSTGSLYSATQPSGIFQSASIYYEKLSGIFGFRGSIKLTLQVNSQRFQQGRLILAFNPLASSYALSSLRTTNLTTVTQLPHVELDIGTMTEATLVIPWYSVYNFYDLAANQGDPGSVILYVYSPLVSPSGDASCDYTIWISFPDAELLGVGASRAFYVSQAPSASDFESKGLVSYTARSVSKFAKDLKRVPILAPIAGTAAWVADVVAQVSSIFGFSVPVNNAPIHRLLPQSLVGFTNCDHVDNSTVMAISCKNELSHYQQCSYTDIDEMSIDYIKGVYAFYQSFTWADTDTVGALKFTGPLHPTAYTVTYTAGPYTAYTSPPFSFLAGLFQAWRGGFKFRLKFVKTEFHTGRLAISFVPFDGTISVAPVLSDTAYLHREILDLSLGSVFEFTVPFISRKAFLAESESYGTIYIHVINQLRAPATASQSISCIVEVAGADDMEYAVPYCNQAVLYGPQCPDLDGDVVNIKIGSMVPDNLTTKMAEMSIGEQVHSLRQILKKAEVVCPNTTSLQSMLINPHMIELVSYYSTTANPTIWANSMWSSILMCYAAWRGSIRIRAMSNSGTNYYITYSPYVSPAYPTAIVNGVSSNLANVDLGTSGSNILIGNSTVNPTPDIHVPYYSQTPMSIVNAWTVTSTSGSAPYSTEAATTNTDTNPISGVYVDWTTSHNMTVYRSAGDDFSCHVFCGVPPVVFPTGNNAPTHSASVQLPLNNLA